MSGDSPRCLGDRGVHRAGAPSVAAIVEVGVIRGLVSNPSDYHSDFNWLCYSLVSGAKARARADFLLAPTRGDSIQAACERSARDVWPVAWRAAGACGEAAGQGDGARAHRCRAARGDRAAERLEGPPGYQA